MVSFCMVVFFSYHGSLLADKHKKKLRKEMAKMAHFLFRTWRGDKTKNIPTKDLTDFRLSFHAEIKFLTLSALLYIFTGKIRLRYHEVLRHSLNK